MAGDRIERGWEWGRKQKSFRASAELHHRVKVKAARMDVPVGRVIRKLLREWVEGGDDSSSAA